MKVNVEKSKVYKFDSKDDLLKCAELLGIKGYFSDYANFKYFDTGMLVEIRFSLKDFNHPFMLSFIDGESVGFKYFIPKHKIVFDD